MNRFKSLFLTFMALAVAMGTLVGCMGGDDLSKDAPDPGLNDQPQRPGEGIGAEIGKKGG